MIRRIAALSLALVMTVALATPAAAAGADQFAGKWVLNASKTQFTGGLALSAASVTISNVKHGIKVVGDATYTDGRSTHYEYGGPMDGSSLAVTGTVAWDSVTMLHPDKATLVRTERKAGKIVGITTVTMGKDGKSLTSVRRPIGNDGPQLGYNAVWDRAKH